jgi:hypothetical protein
MSSKGVTICTSQLTVEDKSKFEWQISATASSKKSGGHTYPFGRIQFCWITNGFVCGTSNGHKQTKDEAGTESLKRIYANKY